MTTTTGGAARVLAWLEDWLQTEWPDLQRLLHLGHRAVGDDRRRRAPTRARLLARARPDIDLDPRPSRT